MTASKIRSLYCCFFVSEASIRAPRARYTTELVRGIISRLTPDLGSVFYSFDECFVTGADPRNSYEKQILKIWTPWTPLISDRLVWHNGKHPEILGQPCCCFWSFESSFFIVLAVMVRRLLSVPAYEVSSLNSS